MIAGPSSNTGDNWSGVHLVCFKHALLSKSGCFRTSDPRILFLVVSHCGIQRCCQVQQERACIGKKGEFGRATDLAFDDEKRSKTKARNTSCGITTGAQPSFKRKGELNGLFPPLFQICVFFVRPTFGPESFFSWYQIAGSKTTSNFNSFLNFPRNYSNN